MRNQKKAGILLSYLNIMLNMCVSIFFTPFLIRSLGTAEYGVYQVVHSFTGQLAIMTFGISTLVARNIVHYNCLEEPKEKENFLAMAMRISLILAGLIVICGIVMHHSTGLLFGSSFTLEEQRLAKVLILLFTFNIAITVLSDFFIGILTGHEKFAVLHGSKTLRIVLRVVVLIVLLNCGMKSFAIVLTDLLLSVFLFVFYVLCNVLKLREKIKYYYFNRVVFQESLLFSGALLFQALINQVNQTLDNFILGIMTTPSTVTLYSSALLIYTAFCSVSTVIASVLTPSATRLVSGGAAGDQLVAFVVKPGRYQFMLCGLVLGGFILFGQEFVGLWLGPEFAPVYQIALILMIPMVIPSIQVATNSILDAKLKRMTRSLILLAVAVLNIIISVILIQKFGYIGAAWGTSIAVVIGHIVIMNIYLHKYIGLNMIQIFSGIFNRLLPAVVLAVVLFFPFRAVSVFQNETLSFLVKAALFSVLYALLIYFMGMNAQEKSFVNKFLKK